MGIGRAALLGVFRRVSRIYFRETEVVGEVPSAGTRGRIFAANHVNGLVDPILVLTNAPCEIAPLAKSTLWKVPVLKWLLDAMNAVPVVRRRDDPNKKSESNDAIFEKVAAHLGAGGNVLIFPEGTSHNEPHLVKLKTGAGRMLARAHAEGARQLTFQAVGLEFDDRESFRSRALVVYGPVRSVDDLAASAAKGDALVNAITERLREDLSELIVEGKDWEDRLLIARVASVFAHEAGDGSLEAWNEIGRQVEAARKAIGPDHAALYAEIKASVALYFDALEATGVTDEEVARGDTRAPVTGKKRRAALLALALPLAIPGAVLYWLPYQIPRIVSRRALKEGHEERDVVSTYKLATGLVVFPLWAGALVGASFVFLPPPLSFAAAAVAVASPFAALTWLDYLDQVKLGRRRAAPTDLDHLRKMRTELSALLERARAQIAPPTPYAQEKR